MKENLKETKGITLVALAVTIVVMIILAGITIETTVGKNGLITIMRETEKNEILAEEEGQAKINELKGEDTITEDGVIIITDEEAPTINSFTVIDRTVDSITVKVNVTETKSGIATIQYSIGDGGTDSYVTDITDISAKNYTFSGLQAGTLYIIKVKATDKNGNEAIAQMTAETKGEVTIPVGFYYVGGTKDSGLVISDNSADADKYAGQETVGTDLQGNQFVWIPVDSIADYKRTAYSTNIATGTIDETTNSEKINHGISATIYFIEAMPEDEKTSVETYKGFYIGRYEAGDAESTTAKTMRASGASTTNTVTLKSGQAPYNWVTRTQAQSLAKGMKEAQGYQATTKLCSSYAWDTAITFIQKTNSDYGNSSEEGNYNDTTFTYTDITGASQTKAKGSNILVPTGQTTAVCNIYDMGGNCDEWTTEIYSYTSILGTARGGYYFNIYTLYSAGYRSYYSSYAYDITSFRPALFM